MRRGNRLLIPQPPPVSRGSGVLVLTPARVPRRTGACPCPCISLQGGRTDLLAVNSMKITYLSDSIIINSTGNGRQGLIEALPCGRFCTSIYVD